MEKSQINDNLKESIKKINNLESSIYVKHIENIETHDGLGDKFLVMVSLKENNGTIGFIVSTDYYSCDLVVENFIFNISYEDFDKINKKNINIFIRKKREEGNKSLKLKDGEYQNNQNKINLFKEEIKDLDLDITFGEVTTIEDIIMTLDTMKKTKNIVSNVKDNKYKINKRIKIKNKYKKEKNIKDLKKEKEIEKLNYNNNIELY